MEFRHEMKFLVSDAQLELIRFRIAPFMAVDQNQSGESYTVTSLYFDDISDRCLQENLDGNDRRSKYRIRLYNNNPEFLRLEKKSKVHGMIRKESSVITREECEELLLGKIPPIQMDFPEQKKKMFCEMAMAGLRPKSIVEYERTAFVERVGNVRITFDKNIGGTPKINQLLDARVRTIPLLPTGVHILEVKFDEFLPGYIADALEIGSLQQTAFSKYCYSRNY